MNPKRLSLYILALLFLPIPGFADNDGNYIPKWMELLKNGSSNEKKLALDNLWALQYSEYRQDPRVWDPILAALADKDPTVREAAAATLRAVGERMKEEVFKGAFLSACCKETKIVPSLIKALEDRSPRVRAEAAAALGEYYGERNSRRNIDKEERAIDPLIKSLHDTDLWVRLNTVYALGELKTLKAIDPLFELLGHDSDWQDKYVQQEAVIALRNLMWQAISQNPNGKGLDLETSTMMTLIKKYHDPYLKKEIMRTLVNYQRRRVQTVAEAKEPVLEAIHDKDDVTRLLAHRIVYNYMPEEDWRSIYLTSLEDPSPSIRALSANSLAMYQNPKVVTPLIKALQDADFRVQKGAVYSLAYHKNDERALMAIAGYIAANGQGADYASEQFINQIIHTSQRVDKKIHATWKNDSAATALLAAFDKANGDGKKKMLVLLRELDDERVVKLFKSLLDDPNPEVRKLASESFEELSATDIYPLVLSKLKDKDMDMEVRQRVLNDLWGLRDRHNIMEPLLEMIKDKDPGVRMSALTVLQKFTDNPPVDQFLAMVDDPDKNIRLAALHAIGNTNDPRATDISLRMLKEKDWVVRDHAAQIIIQKKDPRAVAPLIELLNHDDGEVAARAASLLGVLGDLRAVSPLIEALDGRFNKSRPMTVNRRPGDLYLRDNSAQALGKMKEKSAVPHLIKILSNPNEDISLKAYVARALRMIGDPSALGALRKVVESGELGTNQFYNNEVMDAIEELSRKEGR